MSRIAALRSAGSNGDADHAARRIRHRLRVGGRVALAATGALTLATLTTGLTLDILRFDPTSGGYEPPYTDYTGEPIDWDAATYDTPTGMVATGHVVDVHVNCTTGMITIEPLGLGDIEFRELSERAVAVHRPHEACEERGFSPRFDNNPPETG